MIGKVTATKEQQEAFNRVETAKHLMDSLCVGLTDDQVLMYHSINMMLNVLKMNIKKKWNGSNE